MAEAQLNMMGKGLFKAFSAGSSPTGLVNPFALSFLEKIGIPTQELRSKSWHEFMEPDAPAMDYVLTVCDDIAGEQAPTWLGQPIEAHWGIANPADVKGSDAVKRHAFMEAAMQLHRRLELLISLPTASLDRMSLRNNLMEIGKLA
jgi:arsenate reductase